MEELTLDNQIEAVLFWKGEPQSIKKLAENLGKKEEEILASLEVLKEKIKGRGVELIYKPALLSEVGGDDEVMLGTASKLSHIIVSQDRSIIQIKFCNHKSTAFIHLLFSLLRFSKIMKMTGHS